MFDSNIIQFNQIFTFFFIFWFYFDPMVAILRSFHLNFLNLLK